MTLEKCKGCRHDNECGIICWNCVDGDNYQTEDTKDYDYPETEGEENV